MGIDIGDLSPGSTQFQSLACSDEGIIREILALYECGGGRMDVCNSKRSILSTYIYNRPAICYYVPKR